MKTTKLTWQEVMDKYQEGDHFTAWVDHNPLQKGVRTKLDFIREKRHIESYLPMRQNDIDGFDYAFSNLWRATYKGLFEIVDDESENN